MSHHASRARVVIGVFWGAVFGLAVTLCASVAAAATVTYDADTGTAGAQDGAGAGWNTSNVNFWNGATDVLWPNTTSDVAVFGAGSGAADTVTVGTVTANSITFSTPGSGSYTLSGGAITLGGSNPTLTTNAAARIDSSITSTAADLQFKGSNVLTLGGTLNATGSQFDYSGCIEHHHDRDGRERRRDYGEQHLSPPK